MARSSFKESIIRQSELFSALSPVQWESLRKEASIITLKRDEYLFAEHDAADRFFMVARGMIKLFLLSDEGQEKVLRIVNSGQTFGEALMFLKKGRYPVHAAALQTSDIYSFKCSVFLKILRESPETTFRLLGLLSCRLQSQLQEIDGITLQNAPCRFVRYLLEHVPEEQKGSAEVTLTIPKQVLAAHISVQPASFSRLLRDLAERGLIRVAGHTIHIPNVSNLRSQFGSCNR
ncbi:Crp/Fnr family transcriptional regulator [Candidatus Magnetaquicoccus inordinatus]|uniref:Crp/Fnr family transcriptional regulator n=1 Tax=Candidatus Magnetaquicoccus inordinatus TaxID=2496818 RepID=UPI00187D5404|nr:Crp/Fnr family transcriptional regulator [Candidatus Magnetaquicoccus inordinatus]